MDDRFKDRTFRLADAMNTYNSALVVIREKGYQTYLHRDEREDYLGDFWAIKDNRDFIASDPLRLLGLISIWEHFGDRWHETSEPKIYDEVVDMAYPDDKYTQPESAYSDLDDSAVERLIGHLKVFFNAIDQPLPAMISRQELFELMTNYDKNENKY